ncbi:hypothetical protein [Synechococcus sp. CC9311]|uniref:hypothetical protein n=1 Tax=Synechococcus sp. (strain CC9311) TaxID=64471 RepID=UPI001ED94128|nr:hypothetical protein [Synechococcus sp. CC9311]
MAIASAHWLASKMATQPDREQVRWASFGGGAGMAYVFVHLLPELASHGQAISEAPGMKTFAPTPITEALLFLIALVGIMLTYSLDVLATHERQAGRVASSLHTLNFAAISYLYAYSLPSLISTGLAYGVLFTIAICAHVLLADRTMAARHPATFRTRTRWFGTAALVLGLLHAALFHPVADLHLAIATAFIGGGLLIAVFREELPAVNRTRLGWFVAGTVSMTSLLLLALTHATH